MTRLAKATLISIASIVVGSGIGVGKPQLLDETAVLIAQLADDSYERREAAQQELIETGQPVAARIRAALDRSRDEEQRQRLDAILKQIEEDAILGATRVTIVCENAPLEQVVAEINRQAPGFLVSYPRENWTNTPGPRVSLNLHRQPLWRVLRDICQQTGTLDINPGDDGVRLSLGCGAFTRAPAAVSGPLLIVTSRIAHQRTVEFSQGAHMTSDFIVHFAALAEPKLKLMPGAAMVRLTHAVDELGNSLLPLGRADETFGGGSPFWSFQTRLRYPEKPGRLIARLAGELTFNVASRFETIELTNLSQPRGVATDLGDFRFIIREVNSVGENRYEVTVAAVAPAGEPESFNQLQQLLYAADLRLLDAEGRSVLRSAGPNFTPSDSSNVIVMTSLFDRNLSDGRPAPGPASRLVWRIPAATKTISVPFELTNLPMP